LRKVNLMPLVLGSAGMLVMIFDGKTAVTGVKDGLDLCLSTLIPSLFPFFVLSALVTGSLTGVSVAPLRWVGRLCRMPRGAESILPVGILGGYPVGAAAIGAEYKHGRLTLTDANRMSLFCNNAGPSFLFGMLGPLFPHAGYVWLLWCIQIAATILTGMFLPGTCACDTAPADPVQVSLPDAVNRGIKSMSLVCGWVILFRMLLNFLSRWLFWLLPDTVRILITGLLELSNGCLELSHIADPGLRFLLAGIMLSLGGICVWMQTAAVFSELRIYGYITGRMLHCLISATLSLFLLPLLTGRQSSFSVIFPVIIGCIVMVLVFFLRKQKKAVAFCSHLMYNDI